MYMKKYILSSIILLLAAANTAWGQTYVAKIGETKYETLAEALNAARTAAAGGWNTTYFLGNSHLRTWRR